MLIFIQRCMQSKELWCECVQCGLLYTSEAINFQIEGPTVQCPGWMDGWMDGWMEEEEGGREGGRGEGTGYEVGHLLRWVPRQQSR